MADEAAASELPRRKRVCLLVRENVLHWAPLYVEAFRSQCDVITVGPGLDAEGLAALNLGDLLQYREPNDIVAEEDDALALLDLLPEAWVPDLVVGINSSGPAYRNVGKIPCPTAYISVDTWHEPREFAVASHFDFVFVAQQAMVPYFQQTGSRDVRWLPLGCAPSRHFPVAAAKQFDVTFVGTLIFEVNEERVARLSRLGQAFNIGIKSGVDGPTMSEIYAMGRLAFNSSIAQDVNMRIFEVMAMGMPLLTNRDARANGLFDLFQEDVHLFAYDDTDLLDRVRGCLADEAALARVAAAGRSEVLAKHTYAHRVASLLAWIEAARAVDKARRRAAAGEGLLAFVPYGCQTLADMGMTLGCSKIALRRCGIRRFVGVSAEAGVLERRKGSYDETVAWRHAASTLDGLDAIVCSRPGAMGVALAQALEVAHPMLVDGGTLLLQMTPGEWKDAGLPCEWDACSAHCYQRGFHLTVLDSAESPDTVFVLGMKKFSRSVEACAREIYARFPGGELKKREPR